MIGTLHSNALLAGVPMLLGNPGSSLGPDYVLYGLFSREKVAGIALILAGMAWIDRERQNAKRRAGAAAAEAHSGE